MLHLKWPLQVCTTDTNSYQCCRTIYCFHIKGRTVCRIWKKRFRYRESVDGTRALTNQQEYREQSRKYWPFKGLFSRAIIYLLCVSWLPSISCCFSQSHCPPIHSVPGKWSLKMPNIFTYSCWFTQSSGPSCYTHSTFLHSQITFSPWRWL